MNRLIQQLLIFFVLATAQHDVLMFLQQSASTHSIQREGRDDPQEKGGASAVRPEEGILVWRKTQALEKGASVTAELKPACDFGSADKKIGKTESCVLPYKGNGNFTFAAAMEVKDGFKSSDTLHCEVRFEGSADSPDSLTRWMSASPFIGRGQCNLCGGTCKVEGSASNGLDFTAEFPSMLGLEDQCVAENSKLWTPELSFFLPWSPPAEMNMRASVKWMTDLRNSDGKSRLKQEVGIKVTPPARGRGSTPASSSNPWATSMFALAGSRDLLQGKGLLGVAIEMLKESLADVAGLLASPEAQVAAASQQKSEVGWINGLAARVTLISAENPATKIAFIGDGQRCESEQICKFGIDTPIKFAFDLAMDMELQETDYVTIHCEPKVGGMHGRLIAPYIKTPTQRLSLCSPELRNETFVVPLAPRPFNYTPPLCGRYVVNANMPAFEMTIPDFRDIRLSDFNVPKIPYVPDTVGSIPSMVWKFHVTMRHADESAILDFVAEGGVSQVN